MARLHPDVKAAAQDPKTNDFLTEFQGETDRAAAVLGAAVLDDRLGDLLRNTFSGAAVAETLLGQMQPLGTFSARISVAEAIGAIDQDTAKDLHRVRDIRNTFAHKLNGISFKTQSIADKCRHFRCVEQALASSPSFASKYPPGARHKFNLAVAVLAMVLANRRRVAVRFAFV